VIRDSNSGASWAVTKDINIAFWPTTPDTRGEGIRVTCGGQAGSLLLTHCVAAFAAIVLDTVGEIQLQNAYEALTSCGAPGARCCGTQGHVLANNDTVYDAFPLVFNSAGFEQFELTVQARKPIEMAFPSSQSKNLAVGPYC
jgi:hypothetical protein